MVAIEQSTHLFEGFGTPRPGFPFFAFFPDALSFASFCFSFARVVKPLAAFLTSTSFRGPAKTLQCASTNEGYNGFVWCFAMMTSKILLDSVTKSSLVRGWKEMSQSSSLFDVPPNAAEPRRSAALFRSALSSRSLSRRAFSRGSRTSSESYISSSSSFLVALAASFSASLALSVPFFLGGATGAGLSSSSEDDSSDDSSQSLCNRECQAVQH